MKSRKLSSVIESYLFLLPFGIPFLAFLLFPVLFGLFISFHQWDFLADSKPFVGIKNYLDLLSDQLFLLSLKNTVYFVVLTAPALIILGMLFALLLNTNIKAKSFFRGAIFSAYLLPVSVVAVIWGWMLQTKMGLLNFYIHKLGITHIPWLSSVYWSMPAISLTTVWWTVGFSMVIFLAGLQEIPDQLYEAAKIDGAGILQQFRFITLPLLGSSTLFVAVITVVRSFQVFGQVYIMTLGGPADSTRVIVQQVYETGFQYFRMGSASAQAFVLLLILAILTFIQFKIGRRKY